MRLTRLLTQDFRNLVSGLGATGSAVVDLDTDARFVVISGQNGQGKTNLVEAVWLLATLRPLRGHRVRDLIAWRAREAAVAGVIADGGVEHHLRLNLADRRSCVLDQVELRELDPWFSTIRAIAFTPQDAAIVTDEPERRREWLDRAAFTARPAHLTAVRAWRRVLSHKNAVLRAARPEMALLDVLDEQLGAKGAEVVTARVQLLEELRVHINEAHRSITDGAEPLEIRYRTQAIGNTMEERRTSLIDRQRALRPEELRRRTSLAGPHRDEVVILHHGQPVRTFGSRGQVRTLVLALKIAELRAAHARGDQPVFVLDDLSSELDEARTRRLVSLLGGLDAQVWVTTTDPAHLGRLPDGDTRFIEMIGGLASVR